MNVEINQIPKSEVILIPVANEMISGSASDVKTLSFEKRFFKVHEFFTYDKDHSHPKTFFLLATGQEIFANQVWQKYPTSTKIFFFVCSEIEAAEEPKAETNGVPEL
jgi:hypothetical protein